MAELTASYIDTMKRSKIQFNTKGNNSVKQYYEDLFTNIQENGKLNNLCNEGKIIIALSYLGYWLNNLKELFNGNDSKIRDLRNSIQDKKDKDDKNFSPETAINLLDTLQQSESYKNVIQACNQLVNLGYDEATNLSASFNDWFDRLRKNWSSQVDKNISLSTNQQKKLLEDTFTDVVEKWFEKASKELDKMVENNRDLTAQMDVKSLNLNIGDKYYPKTNILNQLKNSLSYIKWSRESNNNNNNNSVEDDVSESTESNVEDVDSDESVEKDES